MFKRCHKQEKSTVCLKYTHNLKVYERFTEFYNVSKNQNRSSLVAVTPQLIYSSNLSDVPVIGPAYGGTSVLSVSVEEDSG